MPRCFSISIQSEVAWREALRALTEPAIWIAPENSSSFSVSVVLPASGWEMMAKVRRRRVSAAKGEADKKKLRRVQAQSRARAAGGKALDFVTRPWPAARAVQGELRRWPQDFFEPAEKTSDNSKGVVTSSWS